MITLIALTASKVKNEPSEGGDMHVPNYSSPYRPSANGQYLDRRENV
jgi:hypothetical protein